MRDAWGRGAGDAVRGELGCALDGRAHAAGAGAAQDPAEHGALAADVAHGARVEERREILDGAAIGGELPVLAGNAPGVAAGDPLGAAGAFHLLAEGFALEQEGDQGEQQGTQGGREMDVLEHARHAAGCVGFKKGCDLICHQY